MKLDYETTQNRGVISFTQLRLELCVFAILLLGTNYLFYSFFKLEISKNILRIISGSILIACVLRRKLTIGEFILLLFSGYMFVIGGNLTQNIAFILVSVIALEYDSDYVWQKISNFQILGASIVILCLISGIVDFRVTSSLGRIRNTLGFINVNSAAAFFYSVIILWLLEKEKVNWKSIAISIVATGLLYRFTDTRTALVALIVFLTGMVIFSKWNGKLLKIIVCTLESILFVVSQFTPFFYSSFSFLDLTFSYRLSIFARYINANSLKTLLIGGTNVSDIDNFYLCLLFNGGLIFYIFVVIITIYSTKLYLDNADGKKVAFILSTLVFGVMEASAMRCEIMSMLMFWYLILKPLKIAKKHGTDCIYKGNIF